MTDHTPLKEAAEAVIEMTLMAARKRVYWIVRNKVELLRDTGQTKDADLDKEALEVVSRHLNDMPALLAENEALRAERDELKGDTEFLGSCLKKANETVHELKLLIAGGEDLRQARALTEKQDD